MSLRRSEDACRVAVRQSVHALATLRILAISLYEIQKALGRSGRFETLESYTAEGNGASVSDDSARSTLMTGLRCCSKKNIASPYGKSR